MGIADSFNLRGKTALVTGASQGIGRSIALALAGLGADVVVNYRSQDGLAANVKAEIESCGAKCWLWKYDLAGSNLADDFKAFLKDNGLSIDILVLNASVQQRNNWEKITLDEFDLQMHVNVWASLQLMQCCVPAMRERHWGRIVTLGSVQQYRPSRQMTVYAASKAALRNIVNSLAVQLGGTGITVNNLAPGTIATIRNKEVLADADFRQKVEGNIPLGYIGQPDDLAAMAALLCSNAGSYITGDDILVDGGMNLPQ